jgi:phage gp29-like protein
VGSASDAGVHAPQIPYSELGIQKALTGGIEIPKDDPGFQPPGFPFAEARSRTRLIYRDLPLVTIQNSWKVSDVVGALQQHNSGQFDRSGQLVDSILGDDRVLATLASRISALFSRETRFRGAQKKRVKGSKAAQECQDAWVEHWPEFMSTYAIPEMHAYGIPMGFMPGQLVWDTQEPIWKPHIRPWHPRFTYFQWQLRKFIAISQDGPLAIMPGDGKWVLHAPYGEYRGWIRGAVRAVAEPWLIRHFAIRDWARFSEVHGMPIRKAIVPAASDQPSRDTFAAQLSTLGQETTIMVQTGVDGAGQDYDLELIEARDTAWESFPGLRDHCDMAIVLAIQMQNLTTEVQGGSFAAVKSHMDVRQGGTEFDNAGWKNTIYNQIARPFAYLNFGDADLAPWTDWDVTPKEDFVHNADQFSKFGTAIEVLRRGGVEFVDQEDVRKFAAEKFGLKGLPAFKITEPVASGAGGGGGK